MSLYIFERSWKKKLCFSENNNRNYTQNSAHFFLQKREPQHTQHVSYYDSNKFDQFRNIILKSALLIIAKTTTNSVTKLCHVKLYYFKEYNVAR